MRVATGGASIKELAEFPGHHDASFTLRVVNGLSG
jgi:hypothetical protein